MIIKLLLLLVSTCAATDVLILKPVTPHILKAEARAAGFLDAEVYCYSGACHLVYSDIYIMNPAPVIAAHVYIDLKAVRDGDRAELRLLRDKFQAGLQTADDIKRALFLIIKLME